MAYSPSLNTPAAIQHTYSSPRSFQQSYKVLPPTLVLNRDTSTSYRRAGRGGRDNWILGKGANIHDGWDGWSVVQGEKRYWDSKLSKPEFRGKCGGAAANRLSEEKIVKKLASPQANIDVPDGVRRTEVLQSRRRDQMTTLSDNLFKEYFPELTPRKVQLMVSAQQKSSNVDDGVVGGSLHKIQSEQALQQLSLVNRTSKIVKHARDVTVPEPPQRLGGASPRVQHERAATAPRATPNPPAASSRQDHSSSPNTNKVVCNSMMAPAGMPTNGVVAHQTQVLASPQPPSAHPSRSGGTLSARPI